jgi:hypothetical protein
MAKYLPGVHCQGDPEKGSGLQSWNITMAKPKFKLAVFVEAGDNPLVEYGIDCQSVRLRYREEQSEQGLCLSVNDPRQTCLPSFQSPNGTHFATRKPIPSRRNESATKQTIGWKDP